MLITMEGNDNYQYCAVIILNHKRTHGAGLLKRLK